MYRRLGVTLAGVVAFLAATRIPLPFVDADAVAELAGAIGTVASPTVSLTALGIMPFITGFVIVELISLTTPQGGRLRRAGIGGRRRLNRWALVLSALMVVGQSFSLASFVARLRSPGGAPLTTGPVALLWITLAAATFAVALLAEMISRYGLGNGFAVLLVAPALLQVIGAVHRLAEGSPTSTPEGGIMSLIWFGLFAAALVAFVLRRPTIELRAGDGSSLAYRLPPLPQGTIPLAWSFGLVGLATQSLLPSGPLVPRVGFWPYSGVLAFFIVASSLLAGWMVSSRPRLETNLAGLVEVPAETYDRAWWRQLAIGAAVLAVGEVGMTVLPRLVPDVNPALVRLTALLPLIVVVIDLVDTARLASRVDRGGRASRSGLDRVLTLDNVHLAEYLTARLTEEGIECVVTSFRFRRLSYIFGPLFKMALLVPADDAERARALVEATPFEIV